MATVFQVNQSPAHDLNAAIDAFLGYNRAKNLSPKTVVFYQERLDEFRRFLDEYGYQSSPSTITAPLIREFIKNTLEKPVIRRNTNRAATANHNLTVLKLFFGFLVEDHYIQENPAASIKKVHQPKKIIETFTQDQINALLATCQPTNGNGFYVIRDKAIILTLLDTGLRIDELINLNLDDVSFQDHTIRVRSGKGNRERVVPFGSMVHRALQSYLSQRGTIHRETSFFVNHFGQQMNYEGVKTMFQRRGAAAKITGVRVSAHTFRHTFAVSWIRNGGDIFSLQQILGHSTLDMVRIYVNLARNDVQGMHERFSPVDNLPSIKIGRKKIF